MTKPGGRITVSKSVVTDIRIHPTSGRLVVDGVDQDKDGNTLKSHTIEGAGDELPGPVAVAVERIREYAQQAIDDA